MNIDPEGCFNDCVRHEAFRYNWITEMIPRTVCMELGGALVILVSLLV